MKLPSGAELKILPAPFPEAKELLRVFLEEAKGIDVKGMDDLPNVVKNVFCVGFSSSKLDAALWKVLERSTYNGQKIVPEIFEPVKAREDYMDVCYLVAQENLQPFTKSLYARFRDTVKQIASIQA